MISDIENQGNSEQNEQSLVELTPCNLPATIDMQTETSQHNLIMSSLQQKNDDGAAGASKKSGQPKRRVSFPVQNIVTGFFEASNPFAHIRTYSSKELLTIYQESCQNHETTPMMCVLDYLADLEVVEALCRSAVLNLRDQQLNSADCEALEAILKRVQFRIIDLNNCGLDDASASSLFDMIEYYEATNELDVSYNPKITIRGWQSMVSMIKKSQALKTLAVRGFPISISMAANLGQALMVSFIHTLKLEHCGLAGRPIANLCTSLRNNSVLKELWLGHNDLTVYDSYQIGVMLKNNHYLQLLDISNNNIMDEGAGYITSALVQQSIDFQQLPTSTSSSSLLNITDLSASLHTINTSSARFSPVPKLRTEDIVSLKNSNNLAIATVIAVPDKPKPVAVVPATPDKVFVETSDLIVLDDSVDLLLKAPTFEHNDSITKNSINIGYLQQADKQQQLPDNENNVAVSVAEALSAVAVVDSGANTQNSCTETDASVLFCETTTGHNIQCCASDKCTKATDDGGEQAHVDCGVNSNVKNNNLSITSDKPICDSVDLLLNKEAPNDASSGKADAAIEAMERDDVEATAHIKAADEEVLKIFEAPDITVNNNSADATTPPPSPSKRQSDPIQIVNNNNNTTATLPPISQSLKLESTTPRHEMVAPLSQSLDDDFNRAFLEQHQYPERSFSSESLNSETSIDSNDSKSSIKLAANKFTNKYGTLERQTVMHCAPVPVEVSEEPPQKSGLQVLVLWNNGITRNAARSFAELFAQTTTLEIINVGRNNLSNEFLANVKDSLKTNQSLTNLGLQSAHLTCEGAKTLSDVVGFGGNATLQRIDMRDNNIKTAGLTAIDDSMKSNKTVTRIDLDDEPRCRFSDDALELNNEYTRLLNSIRAQCSRNENPPERPEPISSTAVASPPVSETVSPSVAMHPSYRTRNQLSSRKISLTCHNSVRQAIAGTNGANNSIVTHPLLLHSDRNSITTVRASSPEVFSKNQSQQLLDPLSKKSTSTPLRSPLVSPIPSPMSSPVPSPSRSSSRFRVVKVKEPASPGTTSLPSRSPTSTGSSPTFFPNSRFRVVTVSEPNLLKDTSPVASAPIAAKPLIRTKHHTQSLSSLLTDSPPPQPASPSLATHCKPEVPLVTQPTVVPPPINVQEPPISPLPLVVTVVDSTTTSSVNIQPPPTISCLADQAPAVVEKKYFAIGGTSINLTDTLPILSTSFDSPETDLEVKKYMDLDSCSSISSSIESINNHPHHHHHHSLLHRNQPNNEFMCNTSVSSIDSYDFITTDKLQRHQMDQKLDKKPVLESASIYSQINDSFDTASMSDESMSGVVEASSVLSSSPLMSSNEGTLTNSPCLDADKQVASEESRTAVATAAVVAKPQKSEKRVRKTSWIANANSTNYPATLDKLLNLFQHPGSLFTRSSPDMTKKEDSAAAMQQPTRKDSPMGGLFSWVKKDVPPESVGPEPAPQEHYVRDAPHDVKENISPNSTITASTPIPLDSRPLGDNVGSKSKVIFELGSDDDSSSTTDPNESSEAFDEKPVLRHQQHAIEKSDSDASVAASGGLGQIARDSMNVLTAHLERFQDSPKKSFETLHEDREVVTQAPSGQQSQSQ